LCSIHFSAWSLWFQRQLNKQDIRCTFLNFELAYSKIVLPNAAIVSCEEEKKEGNGSRGYLDCVSDHVEINLM
jgi:hypothetical protein